MTWGQQTTDIEVSEHRVQRRQVSQVCYSFIGSAPPPHPPHVSGLLLLCSAIFEHCGAGVLTIHHEAQK